MANNDDCKSCFDSVIGNARDPLECEIREPGKSDCINNLIAMSSMQFAQPVVIESTHEQNGEVGLFKSLCSDSLRNSILEWSNNAHA